MSKIEVVPYDDSWPIVFRTVGDRLRAQLLDAALRIDHIGSTSVPGLDAKPVIDIQISVASLDPVDLYRGSLEAAGFVYRADNPELTKRYFRERPGARRTHIHVRRLGSFSEQFALLFRDYLRFDCNRAREYATLKHELAARFSASMERYAYVEAKGPFTWETMRLADRWAQDTGWTPPPSDA